MNFSLWKTVITFETSIHHYQNKESMRKNQNEIKFLPHRFQKIIALFFTLSIIGIIILKGYFKISTNASEMLGSIILISFFLFMLTSNKIEDEMTKELRLKAYTFAFISCIVMGIIDPYINLVFEGEFLSTNTAGDILRMGIIGYFIGYFLFFSRKDA
jgi:hypothetical protein